MQQRKGFTVVELVVVVVVIAILLTMGVLGLRSMQAGTRDREREADIAAIQAYLETIYQREIRATDGTLLKPAGAYPAHVSGNASSGKMSEAYFDQIFAGLQQPVRTGPMPQEQFISAKNGTFGINPITSPSLLVNRASNYPGNQVAGRPNGAYIYFAHNGAGTSCDGVGASCRRYILLYHLETKEPGRWQVVEGERL